MTFGKWVNGVLTWANGVAPGSANLNDSVDEAICPIGSVVAWLKSLSGTPQTLPQGWVECDGSTISDADSPYNTVAIPNLNSGTQRFLRGSTTSGSTGGSATHAHTANTSTTPTTGSGNCWVTCGNANTPPTYYEVVFILRKK